MVDRPVRGSLYSFCPVASPTKFFTVVGAWSGNNLIVTSPWLVFKVA